MRNAFFVMVLSLCFLVSCSTSSQKTEVSPSSIPIQTPVPSLVKPSPSHTAVIPTIEPTITPTFEEKPTTPLATAEKWDSDSMGPIAYINDEGIFLLNGDGYFQSQIYRNTTGSYSLGGEISWSPDGKTIAFFGNSYADIYLLEVSTGIAKKINEDRLSSEVDPAFSPDGEKIVYISDKEPGLPGKPHNSLYTMNRDGSNPQLIYKCPNGSCYEPDWTSNGNRIVFTTYGDILTINPDGSNLQNLTNGKGYNFSPVWSPDGKKIAFIRKLDSKAETGFLYTMNFDGTGLIPLTTDAGNAIDVGSWSPDGRFIAFKYVTWDGPLAIYISDTWNKKIKQISGSDKFDPTFFPILSESYKPEDVIAQPDCTNGWSKLVAGEKARVAGDVYASPNRVRSGPSKSDEIIGEIKAQTVITVLEGPICADGLVFWKFFSPLIDGKYGWTAEGDGQEYYLYPEP